MDMLSFANGFATAIVLVAIIIIAYMIRLYYEGKRLSERALKGEIL